MKVALVHDWLYHMRGGEKVLESLAEIYPEAVIYTLFFRRKHLSPSLKERTIRASFLQYLPGIRHYYRWLLPLLPFVIRTLKIEDADLVISSSHCVAKGIRIPQKALHVCYCHTPMRYLWGFEDIYFDRFPQWFRVLLAPLFSRLRQWDRSVNKSVDLFIANSENVRARIRTYYEREAEVVHPPVNLSFFSPGGVPEDYYLVVSAFVPYKKIDLVIEAFNQLNKKLMIIGSGPKERAYRALRKSTCIHFLGPVSGEELRTLYRNAQALIFPTYEDFGIVPLEAQACGTPVIAYQKGGALETVRHGIFFDEQTPEKLIDAVRRFEAAPVQRAQLPEDVAGFDASAFKSGFRRRIDSLIKEKEKIHAHV